MPVLEQIENIALNKKNTVKIYIFFLAIYSLISILYFFWGYVNNDEGWYLYASRLVYEGKIPYIDFGYTQSPLFPYLYGIPQLLFGPSLLWGRITSFFLGILTLILGGKIAEKTGGPLGVILTLALWCLNPFTVYFLTLAKTYVLTSFFMVLSLYFLIASNLKNPLKSVTSVFFMSLAVGVRLSVLPALLLLMCYLLYTQRKPKTTPVLSIGIGIITCGLIFFPFWFVNRELLLFNLIGYHLTRADHLSPLMLSINKIALIIFTVKNLFALLVLLLAGLIVTLRKKDGVDNFLFYFLFFMMFSISLVHFVQKPAYPEYHVILVPLAAILIGAIFSQTYYNLKDNLAKTGLVSIIIIMALLTPISQGEVGVDLTGLTIRKTPLQEVEEMAYYIKKNTPNEGQLLAFSTYIAVCAHRKVLPGLEMSTFYYYPNWSTEKVKKYKAINRDLLNYYIKSKNASALFLTQDEIETLPLEKETRELINNNYFLAKTMYNWGEYRDTAYLYLPKKN